MNRYILLVLLVQTFPILVSGQSKEDVLTRKKLKGYNSITIKTISNSSFVIEITIGPNGNILKKEYYSDGELTNWWEGEYDTSGSLIYEEDHSQIYTYNEAVGDHVPVWDEGFYNGKIYRYSQNRLESETYFKVTGNELSNNLVIQYNYDNQGRLLKETHIDSNIGYTGKFEPNSTELDTLYQKEGVEVKEVKYDYKKDTVISTKLVDGKVKGYTFKILNNSQKPIYFYLTDNSKEKIIEYFYSYSKEGYLVEEKRNILNYEKLDMDIAAGDLIKTKYNSKGLPVEVKAYENNKLVYETTYTYKK